MSTPAHISPMTGKPVWLSASGVKAHQRCRRRWWYTKVQGIKEPTDHVLATGLALHATVEDYLKTGTWAYRPGRMTHPDMPPGDAILASAKAGQDSLDVLRAWEGPSKVEHPIRMRVPGPSESNPFPLPFFGMVDWLGGAPATVVDHKSTGNLGGRYIPGPEDLAEDLQMRIYAALAFWAARPSSVTLTHLYYQVPTKGKPPRHKVVSTEIPWSKALEAVETFQGQSQLMLQDIARSAEEVPSDTSACRAFGRDCPFADRCTDSPANRSKAVSQASVRALLAARGAKPLPTPTVPQGTTTTTREDPMSVADLFNFGGKPPAAAAKPAAAKPAAAKPAAAKPAATEPEADSIVPPDAAPTETPTDAQIGEAAQALRLAVDSGVPYSDQRALAVLAGFGVPEEYLGAVKARAGVTEGMPPGRAQAVADRQAAAAKAAAAKAETSASLEDLIDLARGKAGEDLDAIDAVWAVLAGEGGPVKAADAKRVACRALDLSRMGARRWTKILSSGADAGLWDYSTTQVTPDLSLVEPPSPGAAPEPTVAPPEEAAPEPTVAPPEAPEAPAAKPRSQSPAAGRPLVLVGCLSAQLQAVPLLSWLGDIPTEVSRGAGVSDWRLMDYNDGPKMIAARVVQALRDRRLALPAVLHADARSPLTNHVVPVLEAAGAVVVQGVR